MSANKNEMSIDRSPPNVVPAKGGTQSLLKRWCLPELDSRFRGNDGLLQVRNDAWVFVYTLS